MRNKKKILPLLAALVLCISALALPMTAYADSTADTTPPTLAVRLGGDTLYIETSDDISGVEAVYIDGNRVNRLVDGKGEVALKDYTGTGKQIGIYAVDYAGNRSETVTLDNPYYVEPTPTPTQTPTQTPTATPKPTTNPTAKPTATPQATSGSTTEPTTPPSASPSEETQSGVPDGAFTPDGTGTVLDNATANEDDKQFYTITTAEGNVFYLIIDGKRDENGVYFLNNVTEEDLMALAEKEGGESGVPEIVTCTCTEKCEPGAVNTNCIVCKNTLSGCSGKASAPTPVPEEPQPEKEDGSNVGMIILVLVVVAAAGGAGYYFKIVKPKKQAAYSGADEDFEDEGYGEGFDPDAEYNQEVEYLPDDDGEIPPEDGE